MKWPKWEELYTYGTDYTELDRPSARMAIRILKGEKAGELAVEAPKNQGMSTKEMAKKLGVDLSGINEKK